MEIELPIMTPKLRHAKQIVRDAADSSLVVTVLVYAVLILSISFVGVCVYSVHVARSVARAKPIIYRINAVGRPESVNTEAENYTPQDTEMKYFLTVFAAGFYGRDHRTVEQTYPDSLYFLRPDLFRIVDQEDKKTRWMAKFVNNQDVPDTNIHVTNVAVDHAFEPHKIYKAIIDAEQVVTTASGLEQKRIPFVVTCWFESHPGQGVIDHNPLGFQIYSLRADDAFGNNNKGE